MAQRQDLPLERNSRSEQPSNCPSNQFEHISHGREHRPRFAAARQSKQVYGKDRFGFRPADRLEMGVRRILIIENWIRKTGRQGKIPCRDQCETLLIMVNCMMPLSFLAVAS